MSPSADTTPSVYLGRSGPRSRQGCWTCRGKKVKCDEARPTCRRCVRLGRVCDYAPRSRFVGERRLSPASSTSAGRVAGSANSSLLQLNRNHDRDSASIVRHRDSLVTDLLSWAEQHREMPSHFDLLPNLCSQPSPKSVGACGMTLSHDEHEAIRYFRDSFATLYHTKNPKYSVFSILLDIAKDDALVMHMVLAISLRDIDFRQTPNRLQDSQGGAGDDGPAFASKPHSLGIHHYSAALRQMADIIGQEEESESINLDALTSALVLMIMYEQIHGDSRCNGLINHLTGTSLILKHHYGNLLRTIPKSPLTAGSPREKPCALAKSAVPGKKRQLSQYSARLLTRIHLMDASAAFYGIGGQITEVMQKTMGKENEGTESPRGPMDSFEALERYTDSLYRTVWGEKYPQAEMMDDVENRSVFTLVGACGQLRYMNSQLAAILSSDDPATAAQTADSIQRAIDTIGQRFFELLEVAAGLSIDTDNSHRLVANIRWIVPGYHAEVLEFLRLTKGMKSGLELDEEQRYALRSIMTLAVQAYRHGGDAAMLRIARPLITVALETDDVLHREWVLERFEGLRQFGRHCERAKEFLVETIRMQQTLGKRVDVRERFMKEGPSMSLFMF